jgi:hypothetical protein
MFELKTQPNKVIPEHLMIKGAQHFITFARKTPSFRAG